MATSKYRKHEDSRDFSGILRTLQNIGEEISKVMESLRTPLAVHVNLSAGDPVPPAPAPQFVPGSPLASAVRCCVGPGAALWMCVFLFLLLHPACRLLAEERIAGFPTCHNSFTEAREISEGEKVAAQIYQKMPVLKASDPVSVYVRNLGEKLVGAAPGYAWPYNFHVVDSVEINAFALPGGSVFVNLATVSAAENEAELAGVMAHEISHVVLRHSTCNLTRQQHRSIWYGIGQIAAEATLGGAAGSLASTGVGYMASLNFLHMSREAEQQADLLGVQILYDAGYDPRGMPQFFELIQAKEGNGGAQFLSDHPNPGNRQSYVSESIRQLPPRANNIRTSQAFTRIRAVAASRKPKSSTEISSGVWRKGGEYAGSPGE